MFLDVDQLDNPDHLERYIDESQAIIIFLSKGYFHSEMCLRELDHALATDKPLIIVHDPDVSHGGATLESVKSECVSKGRMELFEIPEMEIITWHRISDYQLGSMKDICAAMLHVMPVYEKDDNPPELYIPGDLSTSAFTFEQQVKVHISPHNPGASALAEELQEHCEQRNAKTKKSKTLEIEEGARVERINGVSSPPPSPPDIEVPDDTVQKSSPQGFSLGALKGWETMTDLTQNVTVHHVSATHFILLLNKKTFVGDEGQLLAIEVRRALDAWLPIVLVHEEDPERDGCPFDHLYHSTPEYLINRGLYKKAAITCQPEPLRSVSLALIAKAMGAVPVQTRLAELALSPSKVVKHARKSITAGARELHTKSRSPSPSSKSAMSTSSKSSLPKMISVTSATARHDSEAEGDAEEEVL